MHDTEWRLSGAIICSKIVYKNIVNLLSTVINQSKVNTFAKSSRSLVYVAYKRFTGISHGIRNSGDPH